LECTKKRREFRPGCEVCGGLDSPRFPLRLKRGAAGARAYPFRKKAALFRIPNQRDPRTSPVFRQDLLRRLPPVLPTVAARLPLVARLLKIVVVSPPVPPPPTADGKGQRSAGTGCAGASPPSRLAPWLPEPP